MQRGRPRASPGRAPPGLPAAAAEACPSPLRRGTARLQSASSGDTSAERLSGGRRARPARSPLTQVVPVRGAQCFGDARLRVFRIEHVTLEIAAERDFIMVYALD